MATSKTNVGFSYSTYKGAPKAVTIPTGGALTDITDTVTIPAGVYFVRLATSVNGVRLNYRIRDNSNSAIVVGNSSGGEMCAMFRISSSMTVRASAENWTSSAQTTSNDNSWYGMFLYRLGNP